MQKSEEINLAEIEAHLFDFWQESPILLYIDLELYNSIISPRTEIIAVLARGKRDIHPVKNQIEYRRALSASEIIDAVNKILEDRGQEPVKKSNMFFHIQKLMKQGLLQVVGQLPYGKERHTSYYGRTARMFIPERPVNRRDVAILDDPHYAEFLQAINPDEDPRNIQEIIDKFKGIFSDDSSMTRSWFEHYDKVLKNTNLNLIEVHTIISILFRYDEKVQESIRELSKLMKIHL